MQKQEAELTLFPETKNVTFIRRMNRFVVECYIDGKEMRAYLPNPGKLRELLLTGRKLYVTENSTVPGKKYNHTVVAVERENIPILLHTHMSNNVVRWLIEQKRMPGFEDTTIIKSEERVGKSRFDFLIRKGGKPFLLEVKSCTLFGKNIAMFPDAVTERGRRHLIELAEQSRKGTPAGVIFLVHWPHARWFLPDYHTDIEFAHTFYEVRKDITVKAVSIGWEKNLTLAPAIRELEIPWDIIKREARDCGSYILILNVPKDSRIDVGKLGSLFLQKGHYLYVGSAKKNLKKRIERHLRKRKNFFWHIDHLRHRADCCIALPIRSSTPLECAIAKKLNEITDWSVPGFGSSDCGCETHLFATYGNPLEDTQFIAMIQQFRIDRLETELSTCHNDAPCIMLSDTKQKEVTDN